MAKKDKIVPPISKDSFSEFDILDSIHKRQVPINAISWAARYGHRQLVEELIALGADVGENDNYPLEAACKNGHYDVVKLLLEKGANPYADNYYPLKLAFLVDNQAIVDLVLEKICEIKLQQMLKKNQENAPVESASHP